jgi:hypothetical protein
MKILFNVFWFFVFLKGFSGIYLLINYLLGVDIMFLFKIPIIGCTLIILFFHLFFKIYINFIFYLFLFFFILSMLMAIYFANPITFRTFSHLYTIFICVFGFSFGYFFAKNYDKVLDLQVKKYMILLFIVSLFVLLIYFYFHFISSKIDYFGFDTELPTSLLFFLGQGQYAFFLLGILLILFSGKRAPLISILVIGLIILIKKFNFNKVKNMFIIVFISLFIFTGIFYAYSSGFLWRFQNVASVDLSNEDSYFVATSGRSSEFIGIFNHMNAQPIRWFLGSGLGGTYYIDLVKGDNVAHYQHYTHLSLLSFTFLFGLPFTILLILYIGKLLLRNFKFYSNKYYLGLVLFFTSSLFGAGMFIDPIFWFFLGANAFLSKANTNAYILKF